MTVTISEIPSAHHGIDIMVVGDTFNEVIEACDNYRVNYHPAGYGTYFHLAVEQDSVYIAKGHRFASCD